MIMPTPPATGPPKSRALPEWVTARVLSLDAVEQAYQEAVQSVSILNDTQQCQKSQSHESFGTFCWNLTKLAGMRISAANKFASISSGLWLSDQFDAWARVTSSICRTCG
jgi:hypothetical protein